MIVAVIYIPPDTNAKIAMKNFIASISRLQALHPDWAYYCLGLLATYVVCFLDSIFYVLMLNNWTVDLRKAVALDGMHECVLRVCADQLAGVFMDIFNLSLAQELALVWS